jgi:hypothetical protein
MSENVHTRAQQLMDKSLIEGLAATEQIWLDGHFRECAECSAQARQTQEMLSAFRAVAVPLPENLAARTQLRVRLRAQETTPGRDSGFVLWLIAGMSWLLGIFSAPLVWRGFEWFGERARVPRLALEMGFVLWWAIPALVAVAVVLYQRGWSRSNAGSR